MQLELRTDHDDRTARIVDALTQQVLTEATAFTLDHVGQRLERTLVGAGHGLTATAVIQQRVNGFLQHALFVAHDDVRGTQLEQALQTVITVDNAAIQIVQIRGRKAAAIQRHQRTQIRRQYRQHFENHPLRLDTRALEGFQHLEALGQLLALGFRTRCGEFLAQLFDFTIEIQRAQHLTDAFGTHHGFEIIAELVDLGVVVIFGHDLAALQRRHARVNHDEGFEIEHALDVAQRHVEHHPQTRRQRLQEPDVRHRAGQLDVRHALAAHLGQRDLNATLFTDDATMLQALVLAAQTFVVFHRAKDLGAEQTVTLGLERAVVDGFRLLDFTKGPRANLLGRC